MMEENIPDKKSEELNKRITELLSSDEASEFLKFIKQSEYVVVDQLNRIPAKISLLALLLNSDSHRNALLKVLNEAHVTQDITVDKFEGIVNNITANNFLTFSDDDLPPEGVRHNKALHISIKCNGYVMAKVLVDNGSSVNVLPKSTLEKLPIEMSLMRPSLMTVRAYDGARREVIGEIDL